jgi:hypothetical protein
VGRKGRKGEYRRLPAFAGRQPEPKKQPALGSIRVSPEKRPTVEATVDYFELRPAWRLSRLETTGPFGWHWLEPTQIEFLRARLASFEALSWKEILVRDKDHNHFIELSRLSKPARDRLQELQLDDIDALLSLRIRSRERVFGTLNQGIFYVLWWDPDHAVCPSPKKHT